MSEHRIEIELLAKHHPLVHVHLVPLSNYTVKGALLGVVLLGEGVETLPQPFVAENAVTTHRCLLFHSLKHCWAAYLVIFLDLLGKVEAATHLARLVNFSPWQSRRTLLFQSLKHCLTPYLVHLLCLLQKVEAVTHLMRLVQSPSCLDRRQLDAPRLQKLVIKRSNCLSILLVIAILLGQSGLAWHRLLLAGLAVVYGGRPRSAYSGYNKHSCLSNDTLHMCQRHILRNFPRLLLILHDGFLN